MADIATRRRSLRLHIIAALAALLVLIPVNFLITPRYPWWMWVLTAWMPLIAGHTAWAMGLFDRSRGFAAQAMSITSRANCAHAASVISAFGTVPQPAQPAKSGLGLT